MEYVLPSRSEPINNGNGVIENNGFLVLINSDMATTCQQHCSTCLSITCSERNGFIDINKLDETRKNSLLKSDVYKHLIKQ